MDSDPLPLDRYSGKQPRINPHPMGKLGDDLLVEILIRSFPNPKSASRCKSVCKHWSSLISSPDFNRRFVANAHHHQPPPMPANPNELRSIILSFLPPMPNIVGSALKVLDCFEDLVLCGFWDRDCINGEHGRSYLICNPYTEQWIALPLAPKKPNRYTNPVARLVCEPRISRNLDLGDGQAFVFHEYRFRVVCMYRDRVSQKLNVFCSESGEWIDQGLVLDMHLRIGRPVSSCNGVLFWAYSDLHFGGRNNMVGVLNPFRLDVPPTCIDTSAFSAESVWVTSSSQGALYAISCRRKTEPLRPIVWRLEEDRKSWTKQCEGLVKNARCCSHGPKETFSPFLHPHNPEVIFFYCIGCEKSLLSCDLRTEEVELFAKLEEEDDNQYYVKVYEPRVSCWPTPIPRYTELRGLYDGSYSFWVQGSIEVAKTDLHEVTQKLMEVAALMKVLDAAEREERGEWKKKLLEKDKLLIAAQERIEGLENALRKEVKELAAETEDLKSAVREERDEYERKLLEKDKLLIAAQERIEDLENALRKERERVGGEVGQRS